MELRCARRCSSGLRSDGAGLVHDALIVQAEEVEGAADEWLRDVADVGPARRHALPGSPVGWAAGGRAGEGDVGPGAVDRLREQVAAEEGVDLELLADERGLHRRVVEEGDTDVGVLDLVERALEQIRAVLRVADELLHHALAEGGAAGAREAAAEALDPGDA